MMRCCAPPGINPDDTVLFARQPASPNGSVDTLVERGATEFAKVTAALVFAIGKAVDGKRTKTAIKAAINRAGRAFSDGRLAAPLRRELMTAQMLGALDAQSEADSGKAVHVEAFRAVPGARWQRSAAAIALFDVKRPFADRPLEEAITAFRKRKPVTPDVFDNMSKAAQRRSFTLAGAANDSIVETAHRELVRQLSVGADLRDFRDAVTARLESAGWTPANPSHVETVFRTNVLGAYNGGRYQQISQDNVIATRPHLIIVTPNDGPPRQRPTHQSADYRNSGQAYAVDDPNFPRLLPPFGFNCRCRFRNISEAELASYGLSVADASSIADLELPDEGFAGGFAL